MPVIGRLDKQVDEVLIKPLEKEKSEVKGAQDEKRLPDVSAENASPEAPERGERDSLPVWLL